LEQVDIAIIGAGVVGLAIAYRLSRESDKSIVVLEKNSKPGMEISSRSSEVIHAGLYYPANSLKSRLCMEGSQLLYDFCRQYQVDHRRAGKIIVACEDLEIPQLETLYLQGLENGRHLQILDKSQVKQIEPRVEAKAGLYSPDTGIIDSHQLMSRLRYLAQSRGVMMVFQAPVTDLRAAGGGGYVLKLPGEAVKAQVVINAAGLNSAQIAGNLIDASRGNYRLHYCKGEYFKIKSGRLVNHLVYPVPEPYGLGIHITRDLAGQARLGPNAFYVDEINYEVDESHREAFWQAGRRYLPGLAIDDLQPDYAGIRPKLQGLGEGFRDFIIREETDQGFPGLINLIGIESPGLTSCLAIAGHVSGLLRENDRK
jgi:L-2-hydroxyglutarate oxidase LhgO